MPVARSSRVAGVLLAVLLVAPVAGCGLFGGSGPDARDAAGDYLGAFARGDTAAAAKVTDSPDSAKKLLDSVRGGLQPKKVSAQVKDVKTNDDETSATATFDVAWDLGYGRRWAYEGRMELRNSDDTWRVHWEPTVVHPKLAPQQSIALQNQEPEFAPVLDRDGDLLMSPDRVVSVLFEPAKAGNAASVAGSLAAALGGIDGTITEKSIMDGAAKTPKGQPYQVVLLRWASYQTIKPRIYNLPGVRFTVSPRLIAEDKKFAPTLLPSIRKVVEDDLTGKAGWRVITTDASGAEASELYAKSPEPAQAARVTLSQKVQNAAQAALAGERKPAMLVAMQASTGQVLAVAQNAPADKQGAIALTGRYPPGSTFKIVTAIAGIEGGKTTADTPVGCPGTTKIQGRVIPNAGKFDKGTIPLHSAFAFSCNTSFAQLATRLGPDDLTKAARQLGLGADFVMRGATTVTGSVPGATDVLERAEDGFGQGKVLASPFGMALVAATVGSGKMPTPTLLSGARTDSDTPHPDPVAGPVLTSVRAMMQEVTRRTAALAAFPDVHGKTGTAQFGDGTHSHGWFVGFRGDLAFAMLLTDAGTSSRAVAATGRFLSGLE